MQKYSTILLVGIIVVLAAVLAGVLIFMKNQPPAGTRLRAHR